MSEQEKYTSHMLHAPNGGAIEAVAWWLAPMIAALPALVVGALAELADAEHVRANAIVWGIGAALAASALEGWRGITKRFAGLPLSTAFTIAAIVGGAVGMIAGLTASTSAGFGIRLFCGFAGAVQGGALAWFIVRPDLAPPEVQEDAPNPPTPAP